MPIDFPNSPTNGQTYSASGKTWVFNGTSWVTSSSTPNLGNDSVTSGMILADAVTEAKIATGAVTAGKIAAGAVTSAKISASPTFTGTVTLPSTTTIGTVTGTEIGYLSGVTSAVQTQLNAKSPTASPTFTGTVTLPAATSIGNVSATEIGYVDGVTSAIQTQLDAKAPVVSPTFTGNMVQDFTHGIVSRIRLLAGNNGAGTGECSLHFWVSEPFATWTGCGISRNRVNTSGSFPRPNTGLAGQMMRFDESGNIIFYMMNSAGSENTITFDPSGAAYKPGGGSWSAPSDVRLKDNIRDYDKGTAELMQIRVREWEHNGKGGLKEGSSGLGVVADEIELILPNTVQTYEGKLNPSDEETTDIKAVNPTEITWLLVKTVQEQQAVIADLISRITDLENGVTS